MAENNNEYITNNFQVDYLSNSRSTNENPTPVFSCNPTRQVKMEVISGQYGNTLSLSVTDPTSVTTR